MKRKPAANQVQHMLEIKVFTQYFRSVSKIQMIKDICTIIPTQIESSMSYPITSLQ